MSCLPLFSFSPSIPSALFSHSDDLPVPKPAEQYPVNPSVTSKATNPTDSVYDKLFQVSVSHRRVDSFEWVMTQSAPNTPPTSDGTSFKPYSPLLTRPSSSAPLPVPNEQWSTGPRPREGKQQRGYFDWWPSPSLDNSKGYAMIPEEEEQDGRHASPCTSVLRESIVEPSRCPRIERCEGKQSRTHSAPSYSKKCNHLRPSQDLNALGIVFPNTPPPSPPTTSTVLQTSRPYGSHIASHRMSAPRLPKRVSFSPVVDEVILESFPDVNEQSSSSWGSYLPSSFLVARPPLPRTSSLPVTTVTRPILRRSNSSEAHHMRTTEMVHLSPILDIEDTATVASPLPAQGLPVAKPYAVGHKYLGRGSSEADKAFVSLLQATVKPAARRCDSLLSNASSNGGGEAQMM